MTATFRSPTVEILVVCTVLFVLLRGGTFVGVNLLPFVAVATPLSQFPWTILTSVYAHASLGHLVGNALLIGILGVIIERHTTRIRFHAFVLTTGSLAGIVETVVTGAAVVGASGAAYALLGYALTGNRLTGGIFDRLGVTRQGTAVALVVLALGIALLTYTPGVALLGHATGATLGLFAGWQNVLRIKHNG